MPGTVSDELVEQARAHYDAGDFRRCLELARAALAEHPDEPGLLRLAGRAGLELDRDDAVDYLRRAAELASDDADTWRELGDALVLQGRPAEAVDALRRAVELRPDDSAALIDLGHIAYAAGETEAAIASLEQAVERDPVNLAARRGLVEMYKRAGRPEDALAAARQIAEWLPSDVSATLDVAELSLRLDRLDEAAAAFRRLRDVDPEHELYAYHGMIQTEIRREQWRRALDLAIEATRVDRYGRTTDLLAFVVAQVFGETDRAAPARAEVDASLTASQVEHRQLHEEALVV